MIELARTSHVLSAALDRRAYSAVTAEVGRRSGADWRYAGGRLADGHASREWRDDPGLVRGINVEGGKITHPALLS